MFEGIDDTRSLHNGFNSVHAEYNDLIKRRLDDIFEQGKRNNSSSDFYKNRVFDLMDEFREKLATNKIKCH